MVNGVIDIGNTEVKMAAFEGEQMLHQAKIAYGDWKTLRSWAETWKVQAWILSSVQQTPTAEELGFPFLELNTETPLPVTNQYGTPSTLGKDRIAGICGAALLFPEKAVLVIDAGTCITYDFMTAQQAYLGGNITPGIHMRLKAMHQFTGRLPQPAWQELKSFYGQNTQDSLISGVAEGVLGEASHLIEKYRAEFGDLQVLCCGGDAVFFEKRLKMNIFAAPYLVLIGLNHILRYNQALHA